jgi:DNA-directed RNA polymerase I subunit RPA1
MDTALIHNTVEAVAFSFYTPEQIRNLSVLQLTEPTTYNLLLQPNAGGLYDQALGPLDYKSK